MRLFLEYFRDWLLTLRLHIFDGCGGAAIAVVLGKLAREANKVYGGVPARQISARKPLCE